MKTFICILLFFNVIIAQDLSNFPLWGSNWIIAKGMNSHIYPSFSKSIPTHLVNITFPTYFSYKAGTGYFLFSWANLNHKEYKCTSEMLDDIKNQFTKFTYKYSCSDFTKLTGTINEKFISFKRRIVNDTAWSCEGSLQRSFSHGSPYSKYHVIVNGQDVVYQAGAIPYDRPKWQRKYPLAWGDINCTSQCYKYPILDSSSMRRVKGYDVSEDGWLDYYDKDFCHERIACTDFKIIPSIIWQVHLLPDVKWFPRDFLSGEPLLHEMPMDFKTAIKKRQQSLANMDDLNLKYYRNPYFSDSASTVISFCFIDKVLPGDKPLSERDYLSTVNMPEDTADTSAPSLPMYFDNIPNKIVKIKQEPSALEKAILRLYTDTPHDFYFSDTSFDRCPGWQITDKMLADLRYPRTLQKLNMPLQKDPKYVEDIHWYHGCPCMPITALNDFTKQQLRTIIFNVPPFCSYEAMSNAMFILQRAFYYCENPQDRAQIVRHVLNLHCSLLLKEAFFKKNNLTLQQQKNFDSRCNTTWENLFPRYVTSYTSDLRSRAERISVAVKKINSIEPYISYISSIW